MHTRVSLQALPTLETDNRKVHGGEVWMLKVSTATERIWITATGKISRQEWRDGDFREATLAQ
jgi:hypothetical protein